MAWSAEEGQPDLAFGALPAGVHQYNGLRRPQLQLAIDYGQRGVWWYQCREHVVTAVAWTTVAGSPTVVRGKDFAEGCQQVIVTARAGLDDRQAGCRVGVKTFSSPFRP